MLLAVSGSRVALGSPIHISQGIKDSSATLKYYKRNITHLELKKEGREPKRKEKRSRGLKQRTQEAEIIQRLGD